MSKEAALRAMREARYRERTAGSTASSPTGPTATTKPTTSTKPTGKPAVRPARTPVAAPVADPTPEGDGLCGHRSMNGRTCTREHGHAAKSHRYS